MHMALDLEIAGEVTVLDAPSAERAEARPLVRLRDSHHAVARLIAHGLRPYEVSAQTGYSLSRLSALRADPSFQELVTFYAASGAEVRADMQALMEGYSRDALQAWHEKLLDHPEDLDAAELREFAKMTADRAGYAPVQRSVNKNLNLNIAQRLDARRLEPQETLSNTPAPAPDDPC
jgi:hypothetical protein